jgi:hypothetical protein
VVSFIETDLHEVVARAQRAEVARVRTAVELGVAPDDARITQLNLFPGVELQARDLLVDER